MKTKKYKEKLSIFAKNSFPYFITGAIIIASVLALKLIADSQSRVDY